MRHDTRRLSFPFRPSNFRAASNPVRGRCRSAYDCAVGVDIIASCRGCHRRNRAKNRCCATRVPHCRGPFLSPQLAVLDSHYLITTLPSFSSFFTMAPLSFLYSALFLSALVSAQEPIHVPLRRRAGHTKIDLNQKADNIRRRYGKKHAADLPVTGRRGLRRAESVSMPIVNQVR